MSGVFDHMMAAREFIFLHFECVFMSARTFICVCVT